MGYDFLALKSLVKRNILNSFGNQIGVGKEADVYVVGDAEEKQCCLKIHRLTVIFFLICHPVCNYFLFVDLGGRHFAKLRKRETTISTGITLRGFIFPAYRPLVNLLT